MNKTLPETPIIFTMSSLQGLTAELSAGDREKQVLLFFFSRKKARSKEATVDGWQSEHLSKTFTKHQHQIPASKQLQFPQILSETNCSHKNTTTQSQPQKKTNKPLKEKKPQKCLPPRLSVNFLFDTAEKWVSVKTGPWRL